MNSDEHSATSMQPDVSNGANDGLLNEAELSLLHSLSLEFDSRIQAAKEGQARVAERLVILGEIADRLKQQRNPLADVLAHAVAYDHTAEDAKYRVMLDWFNNWVEIAQRTNRLDRFSEVERIDAGSFGVVFKAWDSKRGTQVAIKLPRFEPLDARKDAQVYAEQIANFFLEARRHAGIVVHGCVSVLDLGMPEAPDAPRNPDSPIDVDAILRWLHEKPIWFSMQFIDGKNLKKLIETQVNTRTEPETIERNLQLMTVVARNLQGLHAHSLGDSGYLIHKDLKPANILIDNSGVPWLTDFGLATPRANQPVFGNLSSGTPHYMAPEQCTAKSDLPNASTARTDIWAWGVILTELLCGELPFTANDKQRLVERILHESPDSPTRSNSRIPKHVLPIIEKCLEKNPEDRYQSFSEVLHALSTSSISPNEAEKIRGGIDRVETMVDVVHSDVSKSQNRRRKVLLAVGSCVSFTLVLLLSIWRQQTESLRKAHDIADTASQTLKASTQAEESSKLALEATTDVLRVSEKAQDDIREVDSHIQSLIMLDLFNDIASKAGVDPQEIKQALIRAKNLNTDTLTFAKQLANEDRTELAIGLALFVAESAIQAGKPDYVIAARGFLFAAQEDAKSNEAGMARNTKHDRAKHRAAIAQRGIDAIQSTSKDLLARLSDVMSDLALERSIALRLQAMHGEPSNFSKTMQAAIKQLDARLLDQTILLVNSQRSRFLRVSSMCLLQLACYSEHDLELETINSSINAATQAIHEAKKENDKVGELRGHRFRSNAQRFQADLVSEVESYGLLRSLADELARVDRVDGERELELEQLELDFERASVAVALAMRGVSQAESQLLLEDSRKRLQTLREDAFRLKNEEMINETSILALKLEPRFGSYDSMQQASKTCRDIRLRSVWHRFAVMDFFAELSDSFGFEETTELLSALEETEKLLSRTIAPPIHRRVLLLKAKLYLTRCSQRRFVGNSTNYKYPELRDIQELSHVSKDFRVAEDLLILLQKSYPKSEYPLVWAEAQEQVYQLNLNPQSLLSSSPDELAALLLPLLEIYTEEAFPLKRASTQFKLAETLSKLGKVRKAEAEIACRTAMKTFTESSWPIDYNALSKLLAKIQGTSE